MSHPESALSLGLRRRAVPRWIARVGDVGRVLWTCRVAVTSCLLGLLLFGCVPQARDLLIDLESRQSTLGSLGFAALLASSALLLWALPVFFSARRSVERGEWLLPASGMAVAEGGADGLEALRARLQRPARLVPWGLGGACLLALPLGAWLVERDLPAGDHAVLASLARGQLLLVTGAALAALGLYAGVIATRRRLYNRTFGRFVTKIPERFVLDAAPARSHATLADALGILSFGALLALLAWFVNSPESRNVASRAVLVPIMLGAWIPIFHWLAIAGQRWSVPAIALAFGAGSIYVAVSGDRHDVRIDPVNDGLMAARGAPARQLELDEAVALWRAANGCAAGGSADRAGCPPPVIVAAAGGASRAAFMTAATLGALLDGTCTTPALPTDGATPPPGRCDTRPLFADRLFAISGVSGGSVGAALYAAALAEAQDRPGPLAQPCRDDPSGGTYSLWHRTGSPRNWRDCLEALASGDFLSRVAVGLAFRDQLPGLSDSHTNRAALLENAFGDAFASIVGDRCSPMHGEPADVACKDRRLSDAFMSFAPVAGQPWRPLLVLNGTSMSTGRRILASHLAPLHRGEALFRHAHDLDAILRRALDGSDGGACRGLILGHGDPGEDVKVRAVEVSLATAATNSARFPIVSPPGTLACHVEGRWWSGGWGRRVIDKVVDGGYFENFGATSALELARALRGYGLDPIVLVISNEPMSEAEAARSVATPPGLPGDLDAPRVLPLEWITGPASGLLATRSARGAYTLSLLADIVSKPPRLPSDPGPCERRPDRRHVHHLTVTREDDGDRVKAVSMSWWLSKPVQEFLHRQVPAWPAGGGAPEPDAGRKLALMTDLRAALSDVSSCVTAYDRAPRDAAAAPEAQRRAQAD